MYAKIKDAVEAAGSPILFDLGEDARTYIANMKTTIKHMVQNPPLEVGHAFLVAFWDHFFVRGYF